MSELSIRGFLSAAGPRRCQNNSRNIAEKSHRYATLYPNQSGGLPGLLRTSFAVMIASPT
jgi:hypothetical protein